MKKIIILLCTCLCLCFGYRNISATALFNITVTNNIEGIVGSTITSQEVTLTIDSSDVAIFNSEMEGEDVTDWFTNIPDNCNFTATISSVDNETCFVEFTGDIDKVAQALQKDIDVTVNSSESEPYVVFSYMNDPIDPSTDYYDGSIDCINGGAEYIITELFDIKYDGPYTVSGYVGEQLTPQIVRVEITSNTDTFKVSDIVDKTLSTVNGLTATVTECIDNKHITITYTGTPIATSNDLIHTTVCKDYMAWNVKDRIVPDREDVRFNIIDKTPIVVPVVEIDDENPKPYTPPVTGVD